MGPTKLLGAAVVVAFLLGLQALAVLDIKSVFEPGLLLPILNSLFAGIVLLIVAYVAGKTYLTNHSITILLMGCGMLSFGFAAISAGWLIRATNGPNLNVTVYNTGAFVGSLLHAGGAILSLTGSAKRHSTGREKTILFGSYVAVATFLTCVSVAAFQGLIPAFFIQGRGPTLLRQIILGSSVVLYVFSAAFLMAYYIKWKSDFLYWYSLSLMLLAIGLFAFFVQKSVGCPIGWLGRSANYVGCLSALIAVFGAGRDARSKGLSIGTAIAGLFADAEAGYKNLVETAMDAIVTFDNMGRIIGWNSAAERMFGLTRDEAVGAPVFEILSSDTFSDNLKSRLSPSSESDEKSFRGETKELQAKRKDGSLFPIELSYSTRRMPFGWLTTCIIRDITERKQAETQIRALNETLELKVAQRTAELEQQIQRQNRAEQALAESEQRFRSIFEHSLDALFVTSPEDGGIIAANPAACAMFGYTENEICALGRDGLVGDVCDPELLQFMKLRGHTGKARAELLYQRKNATLFPAEVSAGLFRDAYGNERSILVLRDITERKRTEVQLRERADDLARSNADLEYFAYIASHDLQEPLRSIASCIQLLEKRHKGKLGEDSDRLIKYSVDSVKRMRALITDLLTYSRLSTKGVPFAKTNCEEILRRSLLNLMSAVDESGAIVTNDPLPLVYADENQLLLIYQNLISNAVKFRGDKPPKIHVSARRNGNEWVFCVKDNGRGIESRYFDRIFMIFQQLDKKGDYEGTGMGLAIVKKIVERHRGRIWVESTPDVGSTFYFTIPEEFIPYSRS